MRILFDHGTPAPLRRELPGHDISTAYELGWNDLSNGKLLDAADMQFDLLITTDKNIKHQQNLAGRRLAILVLPTTNWPKIREHVKLVAATVDTMVSGDFRELELPDQP